MPDPFDDPRYRYALEVEFLFFFSGYHTLIYRQKLCGPVFFLFILREPKQKGGAATLTVWTHQQSSAYF